MSNKYRLYFAQDAVLSEIIEFISGEKLIRNMMRQIEQHSRYPKCDFDRVSNPKTTVPWYHLLFCTISGLLISHQT